MARPYHHHRVVARDAPRPTWKILKGANPAELPVEQPAKFDFAINLTTAQVLRLTIPEAVLAQATEVVQ